MRKTFRLWDSEEKKVIEVEAKKVGKEWKAICSNPKHNDKTASLCINEEKQVYYCQGCGFKGKLFDPSLNSPTIKRKAKKKPKKKLPPIAEYDYQDEQGKLLYQVLKYKDKSYPQRQPDGKGDWIWNTEGVRRVLYKLPELLKSNNSTVFLVEGEKDTDNLIKLGLTATTSPMGAGKWKAEYNQYMKHFKTIILIPDNDPQGQLHIRQVGSSLLEDNFKDIKVLNLPELEEGQDVSDWLQKDNCNKEVLLMLAEEAPPFTPFDTSIEQVLATFKKWLILKETDYIEVVLATVVSLTIPEDPVWLFLVGRSGGSKTEVLRTMSESPLVYALSDMTSHTLVSGQKIVKEEKDPSLLPELHNKNLVIKDFSCILSKPPDERAVIFGALRDSFDGYYKKKFGTKHGPPNYICHYGVIGGVTAAIDTFTSIEQVLGERFIKIRLSLTSKEEDRQMALKALRNVTHLALMRKELAQITTTFLSQPFKPAKVTIPPEIENKIVDLALLVAKCRTSVSREPYERSIIQYPPDPESGNRLVIQFGKLARSLAAIRAKQEVGEDEFRVIKRVGRDTLPLKRNLMIKIVYEAKTEISTPDIGRISNLGGKTALRAMHDLAALKIVEGELKAEAFTGKDGREYTHKVLWWSLTDELRQQASNTALWEDDESSLKARMKRT